MNAMHLPADYSPDDPRDEAYYMALCDCPTLDQCPPPDELAEIEADVDAMDQAAEVLASLAAVPETVRHA